jgi:3-hydroxybutyrate dehydrogenase
MSQKIVIVTGGAQGIGYAIAEAFVKNGDFVAIADLNGKAAEKAAQSFDGSAAAFTLDVTDEESVSSFITRLEEEYGRVDVLVNNAGLQHRDPIEYFPAESWRKLIDVMLTGPFLMTKYVLPGMKKQKYGRIINISSVHGKVASPYKSAYIAAKHGVVGLTRTTAIETATDGITVNTIMPGPVRTELLMRQFEELKAEKELTEGEALEEVMYPRQPMQRFIEPSEIADAAIFIASDQAKAITGEDISVSGGM